MKNRSEIYNTYWYFAYERQNIFFNKINNTFPLTSDPIFQEYKFCNVYRASDRVSQFLIRNVIYDFKGTKKGLLFRIILFRLFNKIETWQKLEEKFGRVDLVSFDFEKYDKFLNELHKTEKIYGNAFILCANKVFGFDKKHENHLALLSSILNTKKYLEILNSKSLKELYEKLLELPLIGNFMAYQIAIDLNYSELFDFDENDFTVAGPGAVRGINKIFTSAEKNYAKYIMYMVENQDYEFERLGFDFKNLFGRKLHAIDCQNLFCEVDKYCRVKFPEIKSNRSKIKQKYTPSLEKRINYFYPPKWKLNEHISYSA